MAGPLAAAIGAAIPALAGGFLARRQEDASRKQSKQDWKRTKKMRAEDRRWFEGDRANDRAYLATQLANDRAYAERMLREGRQYDEARYDELTADDRAYMAERVADERRYMSEQEAMDRRRYYADETRLQALSDSQAERSAASRGIDFKRLRDDAIAAGYNPLTAMAMAGAYSTEVGYDVTGSPYTMGAAFNAGGGAAPARPSGGSGGGALPMSSPMVSGFSAGGGGYTSSPGPSLSSASFVTEALQRGVDTYFNTPPERDLEAESVMAQVQRGIIRREVEAERRADTGFNISRVRPFSPALSYSVGGDLNAAARPRVDSPSLRGQSVEPERDVGLWKTYSAGSDYGTGWGLNEDAWGEVADFVNPFLIGSHLLGGPMRPQPRPSSIFDFELGTGVEIHVPPINGTVGIMGGGMSQFYRP